MTISVINGGGIKRRGGGFIRVFLVLAILVQAGGYIHHARAAATTQPQTITQQQ